MIFFFSFFVISLFWQFETAAAEVLMNLKTKVAGETGEMVEPVPGDVQILLTSKEDPVSMRSLGVSQFLSIC